LIFKTTKDRIITQYLILGKKSSPNKYHPWVSLASRPRIQLNVDKLNYPNILGIQLRVELKLTWVWWAVRLKILEFNYALRSNTYRSNKLLYLTFLGLATHQFKKILVWQVVRPDIFGFNYKLNTSKHESNKLSNSSPLGLVSCRV